MIVIDYFCRVGLSHCMVNIMSTHGVILVPILGHSDFFCNIFFMETARTAIIEEVILTTIICEEQLPGKK